jgi:hypothetical protein
MLHRLPSNFDTTFNSNRSMFSYMYLTRGTQTTRKTMKYECCSWLYAPLTVPTHSHLLGGRRTTREVATHRHMHDIQATHSAITSSLLSSFKCFTFVLRSYTTLLTVALLAGKRWGLQQSPKVPHRLISNFHTMFNSITRVFLHTWDFYIW